VSIEEMQQAVVGVVRLGVVGRKGCAGLVVVNSAADKQVPLQNAKGHLQMIRAQGSSNSLDGLLVLVSIKEMQQAVVGAVRVGVVGHEGCAGLVIVNPAADKQVPLQNAKGHLQMIGAQGSSSLNG